MTLTCQGNRRRILVLGGFGIFLGLVLGFRALVVVSGSVPVTEEAFRGFVDSQPEVKQCFPQGIPPPAAIEGSRHPLRWDQVLTDWDSWQSTTYCAITWPSPGADSPLQDSRGAQLMELWMTLHKMGPWEWAEAGLLAPRQYVGPTGTVDLSHEAEAWFLRGGHPPQPKRN